MHCVTLGRLWRWEEGSHMGKGTPPPELLVRLRTQGQKNILASHKTKQHFLWTSRKYDLFSGCLTDHHMRVLSKRVTNKADLRELGVSVLGLQFEEVDSIHRLQRHQWSCIQTCWDLETKTWISWRGLHWVAYQTVWGQMEPTGFWTGAKCPSYHRQKWPNYSSKKTFLQKKMLSLQLCLCCCRAVCSLCMENTGYTNGTTGFNFKSPESSTPERAGCWMCNDCRG